MAVVAFGHAAHHYSWPVVLMMCLVNEHLSFHRLVQQYYYHRHLSQHLLLFVGRWVVVAAVVVAVVAAVVAVAVVVAVVMHLNYSNTVYHLLLVPVQRPDEVNWLTEIIQKEKIVKINNFVI